jgi:hypothetical protein
MRYLILLLLSSLVGCANRCSEECFLWVRARGTGDEFMGPRGWWPKKVLETLFQTLATFVVDYNL